MNFLFSKKISSLGLVRLILNIIIIISLTWLSYFLYKNFYLAGNQIDNIITLQNEVSLKNIKLDLFNKVKNVHNYKLKKLLPNNIVDVFGTTTTESAASTTPSIHE